MENRPAPRLAPSALLLVGSGFAALVYQVVWTRQLTYLFGATLYAVVTVFAAFMAGLALGAWWWGKRADKMARPIRAYGLLELGIAVAGFLFPLGLHAVAPLWSWGYATLEDQWTLFLALRLLVVGCLLIVPTFFMGGTLPILLASLRGRSGSIGGHIGWLYAANTFGAVAGAYLSGFHLLAWFGVQVTTFIAVGANVVVFLIALAYDRTRPAMEPTVVVREEPTPAAQYSARTAKLVVWLYGISGALAMANEVLWNRGLIFCFDLMKNTTYVFSAILAVYLVGIAIGSAIMSPIARRTKDPLGLFIALQVLLGATVIVSVVVMQTQTKLINEAHFLSDNQILWGPTVRSIFIRTAAVLGFPTLLMGMLYPLANAVVLRGWGDASRQAGRLYAFNTTGAIIGSLAAGFLLIPAFGITDSIKILGVLNVLIGLALIPCLPKGTANRGAMGVLAAVVIIASFFTGKEAPLHPLPPDEELIFYHEGRLATVSVAETMDGWRELYVDNNGVAGTAPYILTDQKSLAHFPMLLMENPRSAVTVGFGSGGCSYSYSLYDEIEDIHCIEITDDVLSADEHLIDSNLGYTLDLEKVSPNRWIHPEDDRYEVIIDDARSYLQHCGRQYDIIATDCTDLRYKTNANLYDLEYFQICRDRITDDGMVVVWMPTGGMEEDLFRCAVNTFYQVFPHTSIWFMNNAPTHYVLFIGTKNPQQYSWETLTERLNANPDVVEDLEIISLEDPHKILSCFAADERTLAGWLDGAEINTEDDPIIEFQAPRQRYGQQPVIDNTNALFRQHASVIPLVTGMDASEEALLAQYEAALPDLIEGFNLYRQSRMVDAALSWKRSLDINPHDTSLERLLQFEQLRLIASRDPNTFDNAYQWEEWVSAHLYLIMVERVLGNDDEARRLALRPVPTLQQLILVTADQPEIQSEFRNWLSLFEEHVRSLD